MALKLSLKQIKRCKQITSSDQQGRNWLIGYARKSNGKVYKLSTPQRVKWDNSLHRWVGLTQKEINEQEKSIKNGTQKK